MSGEKLSFCVLKDDRNNEMSGEKLSLRVFKDDRGDHHGGTSFFTTAGGHIGNLESKQSDVEYWGLNMPSNAFIFYTSSRIPNLLKKSQIQY